MEEVKTILTHFPKDKIPGSNGWIVEFCLHFFYLLGKELSQSIDESRRMGHFPSKLNEIYIALLPKKDRPNKFMITG